MKGKIGKQRNKFWAKSVDTRISEKFKVLTHWVEESTHMDNEQSGIKSVETWKLKCRYKMSVSKELFLE